MRFPVGAAICGVLILLMATGCSGKEENPPVILEEQQVISAQEFSPPALLATLSQQEEPVEIPAAAWGIEGTLTELSETTATCAVPMPVGSKLPVLTLDPPADRTEVEIFAGDQSLWQGTLEELEAGEWQPPAGSTVELVVEAYWQQSEEETMQASYLLAVELEAPLEEQNTPEPESVEPQPVEHSVSQADPPQQQEQEDAQQKEEPSAQPVTLSSDSIQAGRMVVIRYEGVPEEYPAIETNLGFTPVFFEDEGGLTAYLPVNNGSEPGEYQIIVRWSDGQVELPLTVTDGGFEVEIITMDQEVADSTINSSSANAEFETVTRPLKNQSDDEQYWSGPFVMPVAMDPVRTSSSFGYTRLINGVADRHNGVDFPVAKGTPVTAPNNGRVLYAGYLQLTGNTVCIEHGFGLKSWYYHMDSLSCSTGDFLETGDPIGAVGSTGYSTGPHLHFALSVNNVYIDPFQLMNQDLS